MLSMTTYTTNHSVVAWAGARGHWALGPPMDITNRSNLQLLELDITHRITYSIAYQDLGDFLEDNLRDEPRRKERRHP